MDSTILKENLHDTFYTCVSKAQYICMLHN